MKGNPFKRAIALMGVISDIMAATVGNYAEQQSQLNALHPYVSRGKGKGKMSKARHGAHMDRVRHAKTQRNIAKRK